MSQRESHQEWGPGMRERDGREWGAAFPGIGSGIPGNGRRGKGAHGGGWGECGAKGSWFRSGIPGNAEPGRPQSTAGPHCSLSSPGSPSRAGNPHGFPRKSWKSSLGGAWRAGLDAGLEFRWNPGEAQREEEEKARDCARNAAGGRQLQEKWDRSSRNHPQWILTWSRQGDWMGLRESSQHLEFHWMGQQEGGGEEGPSQWEELPCSCSWKFGWECRVLPAASGLGIPCFSLPVPV